MIIREPKVPRDLTVYQEKKETRSVSIRCVLKFSFPKIHFSRPYVPTGVTSNDDENSFFDIKIKTAKKGNYFSTAFIAIIYLRVFGHNTIQHNTKLTKKIKPS